jgi:hypothetical protein
MIFRKGENLWVKFRLKPGITGMFHAEIPVTGAELQAAGRVIGGLFYPYRAEAGLA